MATPKPPTTPAADFSAMAGQGFEAVTASDYIDQQTPAQIYWRIWLEHRIPFALFKAWREYRLAGVVIAPEMQAAVDEQLLLLAAEQTAQDMAKAISGNKGAAGSLQSRVLELERSPVLDLLRLLLALPTERRIGFDKQADVFRIVAGLIGDDAENVEALWKRYGKG